ncbi:hypothetical protein WJX72_006357 [[Myrmecia] bisecta]|uniref:Uncharacterized protein n=1 Tax=[Myrmecia] bisecta TaxID=41462 RepID=A0AAW1QR07_9CHLO
MQRHMHLLQRIRRKVSEEGEIPGEVAELEPTSQVRGDRISAAGGWEDDLSRERRRGGGGFSGRDRAGGGYDREPRGRGPGFGDAGGSGYRRGANGADYGAIDKVVKPYGAYTVGIAGYGAGVSGQMYPVLDAAALPGVYGGAYSAFSSGKGGKRQGGQSQW